MADQQPSQHKFTIGDATSFGWETMKKYMGFLIPVVIIIAIVNAAESGLSSLTRYMPVGVAAFYGTLFTLISITVSVFIYMAYIKIGLRYCDGEEADYNDLYNSYPKFWYFLAGSILYGLIVIAGLILLIIPGIYWAIKYSMFGYLIIDRDMDPVEAIKKSGEITYGEKWHLLGFWIVCFLILLVGLLLCIVGLLFAVPTVIVAVAYVYRSLLAAAPERAAQPAGPPPMPPPATGPAQPPAPGPTPPPAQPEQPQPPASPEEPPGGSP